MFEQNTKEQVEGKLLILNILKQNNGSLNEDSLIYELLNNYEINYFLLFQYLYELNEADFVNRNDNIVTLLSIGETTLELLSDKIPKKPSSSLKSFSHYSTPTATGYIEEKNGRYIVNLTLHQDDEIRFHLTLDYGDKNKANSILEKWLSEPGGLFLAIKKDVDNWMTP
ncbi:MAG: DUF4364 family protein [Tissierellia bacterium]|nr:DUF4364 family protein [Tissierellia bacterium]